MRLSAAQLRQEISARNVERGAQFEYEVSASATPSVIYSGARGNFLPSSYARIAANPEWRRRLTKVYTASRFVPRAADRRRYELECANSSDALLMNVFCYPRVMDSPGLRGLLGVERGTKPEFGVRARIPLKSGREDRTEIDMRLGALLVEAKLTEGDFQRAEMRLLERYAQAEGVFEVAALPVRGGVVHGWQLIRGVLAAHAWGAAFTVVCDGRRGDLVEMWYAVMRAVSDCGLRTRLGLLTWQETAAHLPPRVQRFLREKYGIEGEPRRGGAGVVHRGTVRGEGRFLPDRRTVDYERP